MPLVSVIIPTYGDPVFLEKSIKSVLNQSYRNIELIVVDDNNPGTKARSSTEKKIASFTDPRLKYIKHAHNMNGAVARNSGIAASSGRYVAFLDSDDEYLPNRVEKCLLAIRDTGAEIAGVYTGCEFRRKGKKYNVFTNVKSGRFIVETLACTFMFCSGSNIFVKKDVIEELNGFDESFLRHQDYEFLVRLFKQYILLAIPEVLIIKNNENFNLPNLQKQIDIKEQYFEKFKREIELLTKREQQYVFHCNAVAIAENALKQKEYRIAYKYYSIAFKHKMFSCKELIRMIAIFFIIEKMYEIINRLYGQIHLWTKRLLHRNVLGVTPGIHCFKRRIKIPVNIREQWIEFIIKSKIDGVGPYHYAGYNEDINQWCLPSWIWTNAALVRTLMKMGQNVEALKIVEALMSSQEACGGWIVRNDYDKRGAIPVLAPNDSAYIANNALIEAYLNTHDVQYLNAAQRCAGWIISTARQDGLVYTGYNARDNKWMKDSIIVDTGFTAGLFARLYEITKNEKYRTFLECFLKRYIELFYIPSENAFCTSINADGKQQGGMFGRGQAWALEGLISAYKVLGNEDIKIVIEHTIDNLLSKQAKNGGWAYNLAKPFMGQDCKGISVLAKSLMDWYALTGDERCYNGASKALNWCINHTVSSGEMRGGIFSYTVEGGIVENLYSSCAFVYASAYALEVNENL